MNQDSSRFTSGGNDLSTLPPRELLDLSTRHHTVHPMSYGFRPSENHVAPGSSGSLEHRTTLPPMDNFGSFERLNPATWKLHICRLSTDPATLKYVVCQLHTRPVPRVTAIPPSSLAKQPRCVADPTGSQLTGGDVTAATSWPT